MKKYSVIFIILCMVSSCIKKADIELPKSEKKLVVSCFISPDDSIITATVRLSTPKFGGFGSGRGGNIDDIQNASVVISDGVNSIKLVFDNTYYFYKARTQQFPILSGKTYYLRVSTPDGKEVNASTTVPLNHLSFKSLDVIKIKDGIKDLNFNVNMNVNDIAGQTTYMAMGWLPVVVYKNAILNTPVDSTDRGGVSLSYFDDDEKVAKTSYFNQFNGAYENSYDTISYAYTNVAVLNCSKEFYLYNKSAVQASFTAGNPFSDPVLVYSSFTNGFGCFGAYMATTTRLRIK